MPRAMATRCFMPPGERVRIAVGEPGQAHLVEVVHRALGGFPAAQRARGQQREHRRSAAPSSTAAAGRTPGTPSSGPGPARVTRGPSRRIAPSTGLRSRRSPSAASTCRSPRGRAARSGRPRDRSKLTRWVARDHALRRPVFAASRRRRAEGAHGEVLVCARTGAAGNDAAGREKGRRGRPGRRSRHGLSSRRRLGVVEDNSPSPTPACSSWRRPGDVLGKFVGVLRRKV